MRSLSRKIFFIVGLLLFLAAYPVAETHAANGIPCDNPHTATAADIAAGYPRGSQVCPSDYQQSGVTPESGEAKNYLQSLMKGASCGPYRSTADKLDPQFAICGARFLKAVREKDSRVYIASAYRSTAHQGYLCAGGCGRVNGPCARAGESKHQRGLAIDISNGAHILPPWIQAMGRGYGVSFPVRGDSGHMEPIAGSGCADPNFKPSDTAGSLTPTSGIADRIRKATSPQPQPQPTPPQQTTQTQIPPPLSGENSTSYQPGVCAPQFYCANNNLYYRTSSCVDQLNQVCPKGCSGVSCVDSPTTSDLLTSLLSTNTKPATTTKSGTSTPSIFDQINAFAGPTVVTVTQNIATSVNLTGLNGQPVMTLVGSPQAQLSPGPLANTYQLAPPASQQTFISGDLNQTSGGFANTAQPSTFQKALAEMKTVVLTILDYLRPFGRPEGEGYYPGE